MTVLVVRNAMHAAALALLAACGGGGGSSEPAPARAQAPAYDVIAEITVGSPNSTVAFRKLDGSVIATHTVCPRVCGSAATAMTRDGYVRIRCSRDTATNPSTVFEFNPSNWAAAPVAVTDDTITPQALRAIISFGPNGEEFYNKTVFETGSGKPIDTLFSVSGGSGQRVARDVIALPNYMGAMKITYSDNKRKAYLLASDGFSNSVVYEIDLGTLATRQVVIDVELIKDIALNDADLVYTRIQNAAGQAPEDMVVVNIASGQTVRKFDFTCPNDAFFQNQFTDFGGKIVQAGSSFIVGSGLCHQIFSKADYSLNKWNYPTTTVGPLTYNINVIPEVYDGVLLWSTYQLPVSQLQTSYLIAAYDVSSWLTDGTPKVFVSGTLGDLVHLVH